MGRMENPYEELNGRKETKHQTGLTLSWHRISVWVKKKDEARSSWFSTKTYDATILDKVSGVAEPGNIMAILGPSGAGKTTLLATISHRRKANTSGEVLVNGQEISKKGMLKVSGFVPQKDLVVDSLTVMEHLQFMARMKMDRHVNKTSRTSRILALMSELGIVECRNRRLSALSGGEKKRVSIAVQLLTDPSLIFCDEPTTGLDSYSAQTVIEQLKRLSAAGKTVLCTIHQPASGLIEMFDSVFLLASGGRTVLTCSTIDAEKYFNRIGIRCPPTYNLAEFLVSQMATDESDESRKRVEFICAQYKKSKEFAEVRAKLDSERTKAQFAIQISHLVYEPINELEQYTKLQPPARGVQLYWLTWRSFLDMIRNPKFLLIRLALYLSLALLISVPYIDLEINQEGIQNRQGFLYLVIVETAFTFTYTVSHTFPSEIPILLREVDGGLYTPGAYYVSKMLILLPRAIVEPLIYAIITFCIPQLNGGFPGFLLFSIPVLATSIAATAYGCLISALFESITQASMFSVPFEQTCILFCGLYMSLSDVPLYFSWIRYVSIFYYGLEALSILQWTSIKDIPCRIKSKAPCISSGQKVLEFYGYSENHLAVDLFGLASIYCICHVIGFLAFWKRSQSQAAY